MSRLLAFIGVVAIGVIALYISGGGFKGDERLQRPIEVISRSTNLELELRKHKPVIGDDFEGYRNHLYRVLTYTKHLLSVEVGGEALYYENLPSIEFALVYHDIALWTDNKLAYLEPSIERAKKAATGQFSSSQLQTIIDIIYYHHKFTAYKGPSEAVVNAVRKADFIDATDGAITFGMPKQHIAQVKAEIADNGFHAFLNEVGMRIHGYNIPKIIMDMGKVFKI